jgi:hypothetical protein
MSGLRLKAEGTRAGTLAVAIVLGTAACHARPPATTPPSRAASANRPPSVRARCEPCAVPLGKTATVSAVAQDPDADPITYAWTAAAGALANSSAAETQWTAPAIEGPVPVAITVTDDKGGTASDVITIQVTK